MQISKVLNSLVIKQEKREQEFVGTFKAVIFPMSKIKEIIIFLAENDLLNKIIEEVKEENVRS